MPRSLAHLFLTLALTGPLLAQAEAASDLARSLAGLVSANNVEPRDEGVGDDPVVAAASETFAQLAQARCATPFRGILITPPLADPSHCTPCQFGSDRGLDPWPFATAPGRLARLQVFQI
jgi:hypothetical protein